MSKESLDYSILCPNYYANWEEGCCMENCTHNDLNQCPIHYVKGLLDDKDQQIKILQKALELACNDVYWICAFSGKFTKEEFMLRKIDVYTKEAKEMVESE